MIKVRLTLSCRSCFLMYSHTFLVTSVRGKGLSPTMTASWALGVSGFRNAALGTRFLAGAAVLAAVFAAAPAAFSAGAAFFAVATTVSAAAIFFAGAAFLAGAAFFAVAMLILSIMSG